MSAEDIIEDQFQILQEETAKAMEQVQAYQHKMMTPVWEKRREIVKNIPNFWGQAIRNHPFFAATLSENDAKALDYLTDFHVEYDEANPKRCKVTATFKENDIFKNKTLTKEVIIDPEEGGTVVSKSAIEYHGEKSKKRKADEDDELENYSAIEWFGDDTIEAGILLIDDIFPDAFEYYTGNDQEEEEEEEEEEE
ncbi:hypothetical protein G6F57_006337 [Rhizopus arrhizus]|uniref:Template-activating factor I n=1 Tax=Rhizopus oryzae TaxID=64495 RepID=A0A9P6XA80_RHIOR|nr:hypothetical protein G6F23_009009 [Rhizopus arrhizus]KAG1421128.1 hypothetical protein G6F58_003882 [Rhizopus delemar]KAG0763515.1 hypothetical protein G6F24_005955 [Rhizopus arrhizus]KAG0779322.1 hypothetical protein G6F22_010701 [Rhizopus arrhizus]KAG0796507.1 hypothetical protein G6F21_001252 [Rhizopus arrhizus]